MASIFSQGSVSSDFAIIDLMKLNVEASMRSAVFIDANSFKTGGDVSTGRIDVSAAGSAVSIRHVAGSQAFGLHAMDSASTGQPNHTSITLDDFQSGSNARIDGLNAQDFALSYRNVPAHGSAGQGGLQVIAQPSTGCAATTVTLRGYSTADLSNGRLSAGFATTPSGQSYLSIHAT